jgi:hypothetical protein
MHDWLSYYPRRLEGSRFGTYRLDLTSLVTDRPAIDGGDNRQLPETTHTFN